MGLNGSRGLGLVHPVEHIARPPSWDAQRAPFLGGGELEDALRHAQDLHTVQLLPDALPHLDNENEKGSFKGKSIEFMATRWWCGSEGGGGLDNFYLTE